MTGSPCKYCTDRMLGCHGLCREYNNWLVIHQNEKKQIEDAHRKENDNMGAMVDGIHRMKTRRRK